MKFININKLNSYIFEEMDPFFMLSYLEDGDNFAIGSLGRNERGFDYPNGLAICKWYGERLVILWFYVKPEYRLQGVGDALLEKITEIAKKSGTYYVEAYFNNSKDREMLCKNAETYFMDRGFYKKVKLHGEWLTDVRTLLDQPYFKVEMENKNAVALNNLPKDKRYDLVLGIMKKAGQLSSGDETLAIKYDADLSFIIADKNSTSAIIVCKMDEMLLPICFMAKDEEKERELIFSFLKAAEKKYGNKNLVRIVITNRSFATTMKKIYKEGQCDNYVLSAKLKDILNENAGGTYPCDMEPVKDDKEIESFVDWENYLLPGEDIITTLGSIKNAPAFAKEEENTEIKEIEKLNLLELYEIVSDARHNGYTGSISELPAMGMWLDTELSCYMKKDGKLVCFFIAAKTDKGEIRPVMLFSKGNENSKYLISLLQYAYGKAMKFYDSNTKIILRAHSKSVRLLYNKLLNL